MGAAPPSLTDVLVGITACVTSLLVSADCVDTEPLVGLLLDDTVVSTSPLVCVGTDPTDGVFDGRVSVICDSVKLTTVASPSVTSTSLVSDANLNSKQHN